MLSDDELIEFYRIDEDDVQTLEFVRTLKAVGQMEIPSMINAFEKLDDIDAHLAVMSRYILDGTRSDELCRLLDDTFYRFRNMKRIVEDIMSHHDIFEESFVSPTNDASMNVNSYMPLPFNKSDWFRAYFKDRIDRDLLERQKPDFSKMTLNEKVNYLLGLIKIIEFCENRRQMTESNNHHVC